MLKMLRISIKSAFDRFEGQSREQVLSGIWWGTDDIHSDSCEFRRQKRQKPSVTMNVSDGFLNLRVR